MVSVNLNDSGQPNPYLGTYNTLLSGLFLVHLPAFMLYFDKKTRALTVAVRTAPTTWNPVFFCLVVPMHHSEADDGAMTQLLQGKDIALIEVAHGVCVSGRQAWFYKRDRTGLVSRRAEFDLGEKQGAMRFVQVVEDVKNMCRELIGELPEFDDSESSDSESESAES